MVWEMKGAFSMMDFHKLIDSYKTCTCGVEHRCDIRDIRVGSGLVHEVGQILRENNFPNKILLVADTNTYATCGSEVAAQIGQRLESTLVYRRQGLLIPNEEAIERVCAQLDGVWERKDDEDFSLGEKTVSPRIMRLRDQMSRCILEKLGMESALRRLKPNEEAFADNPRNLSMDPAKLQGAGIVFPTTAEGLILALK